MVLVSQLWSNPLVSGTNQRGLNVFAFETSSGWFVCVVVCVCVCVCGEGGYGRMLNCKAFSGDRGWVRNRGYVRLLGSVREGIEGEATEVLYICVRGVWGRV